MERAAALKEWETQKREPIVQGESQLVQGEILGRLEILSGQEPSKVIAHFCKLHELSAAHCKWIMQKVCANIGGGNGVICNTHYQIYDLNVTIADGSVAKFVLHLGIEPIDAAWTFCDSNGVPNDFAHQLLDNICKSETNPGGVVCSRRRVAQYSHAVEWASGDDSNTGVLEFKTEVAIYGGEEPIDALYRTFVEKGLPMNRRWTSLLKLCQIFQCKRGDALLAQLPVQKEDKTKTLKIYEGHEPVDQVFAFVFKHAMEKNFDMIMDTVCKTKNVICHRADGLPKLFELPIVYYNVEHKVTWYGTADHYECRTTERGEECRHRLLILTEQFCNKFFKPPGNCERDMMKMFSTQLKKIDAKNWKGKQYYKTLGLKKDASPSAIEEAYRRESLRTTADRDPDRKWELEQAYKTLGNPVDRAFYDQPCKKFAGLAGMCAKMTPGGGMNIEVGHPDADD